MASALRGVTAAGAHCGARAHGGRRGCKGAGAPAALQRCSEPGRLKAASPGRQRQRGPSRLLPWLFCAWRRCSPGGPVPEQGLSHPERREELDDARLRNPAIARVARDRLLQAADFVVCLASASAQTENLMDEAAFARMKLGACFVNASRGKLVDEAALLDALDSGQRPPGRLRPRQMPSPALAQHPRVVATPYIGGLTLPAIEHQALETVAQLTSSCWPGKCPWAPSTRRTRRGCSAGSTAAMRPLREQRACAADKAKAEAATVYRVRLAGGCSGTPAPPWSARRRWPALRCCKHRLHQRAWPLRERNPTVRLPHHPAGAES